LTMKSPLDSQDKEVVLKILHYIKNELKKNLKHEVSSKEYAQRRDAYDFVNDMAYYVEVKDNG
jgi:hypothetical protein